MLRPWRSPEWAWALGGATALVVFGIVSPAAALVAVGRGSDVYLFLTGMLVLADLARAAGVFDWLAALAVRAADGSAPRFFTIVFGLGVGVTVFLSNDATAVVLTPAVAAAARAGRTSALPYLFTCAFVANAASFVLPIANPANLVIFGGALPPLGTWIATFALPSLAALVVTFVVMRQRFRREFAMPISRDITPRPLGRAGRMSVAAILATALALGIASSRGIALGAVTASAAGLATAAMVVIDRQRVSILRHSSWSVIALVAGLFVLVAGLDQTGVLDRVRHMIAALTDLSSLVAIVLAGVVSALLSNATNNLPTGLLAGLALAGTNHSLAVAGALTIGIDLGPNLSVTGSLATVLWLVALRREGIALGAGAFLRVGALVMPPALLAALGALALVTR